MAILDITKTNLAVLSLREILIFFTKFGVNLPFGSEEEKQNKFPRLSPLWPYCIFNLNDFSYY